MTDVRKKVTDINANQDTFEVVHGAFGYSFTIVVLLVLLPTGVLLVIAHYDNRLSVETFEGAQFASLRVREHVRLPQHTLRI